MICGLQDSIDDIEILCKGYIERNSYIFTSLTYPYNIYDAIVIKHPMNVDINQPCYGKSIKNLEDHISLINKYQLEKAVLLVDSLDFIVKCPSLKYLHIVPSTDKDFFDFSPIYNMPEIISLDCQTCYGREEQLCSCIDYQRIKGLKDLSVSGKGHVNYNKIRTLKSLQISGIKINNLTDAFCSSKLDTMRVITCGIKSLDGIEKSKNITCLYLQYNRLLKDISALRQVKSSLRALRIENCPKIEDFSVLYELENLELLEITGNNSLPDLYFLKEMKKLKTFIFSVNILNGDLTPCINLNYVFCEKSRRHYNLKDKDLPKGRFIHGNEGIEMWRRLE